MKTKICIQCKIEKKIRAFYADKRIKDGYRNKCKECVSLNNKNWRENNKEKVNEINKNWRENNKEKVVKYNKKEAAKESRKSYLKEYNKTYMKAYYEANKERFKEKKKENNKNWTSNNPEYMKVYYEANKDKIKIQRKERQKIYKEVFNQKRAERRHNDPVFHLTDIEMKVWENAQKNIPFLKEMKQRLREYQNKKDVTQLEMVYQMIDDWITELEAVN